MQGLTAVADKITTLQLPEIFDFNEKDTVTVELKLNSA